jgi:integrase
MNLQSLADLLRAADVEIPRSVITRSGVQFDPSQESWNYRDGVNAVNLHFGELNAPPKLRKALKLVLTWYAEHMSPSHLSNVFERFKHFASTVSLAEEISSFNLINYRATLNGATEWYLGSLSGLLKRWHRMRIPGVSNDALKYLNIIRIKGNRKGVAVLTMDPDQGRFTDIELEAIRSAIGAAYKKGHIESDAYILAILFIALGPRPIQYAAMKVCDVQALSNSSGNTSYIVSVPRAKRREARARSSFKKRTLIPEIGALVLEYANEVRSRFVSVLDDPDQAPLFPASQAVDNSSAGFEFHRTSDSLRDWFKYTMKRLEVRSERTGRSMNINATRFRRTLACRAADEGHGELVIAELLDHTDTQNAGVYVEATPGMMERIDRAVALKLAPLAQAFSGTIITDESQARRANDPTSRIRDPRFDSKKPVGNCGQFGFCGLLAPVACYTCRSFEPWLDGPHERVLEFLIAERDRLLVQADKRVASINDRTILAVADVVRRCAEIKGEPIGDLNG